MRGVTHIKNERVHDPVHSSVWDQFCSSSRRGRRYRIGPLGEILCKAVLFSLYTALRLYTYYYEYVKP